MTGILFDRDLLRHTFVVIDFETLTPKGRPPEPIEVAAVFLACHDGELAVVQSFEGLMRPPPDVPVTEFDIRQTGLSEATIRAAPPVSSTLGELDRMLTSGPYRLVAHHAGHEAALIARQRAHCATLSGTPLLDTVRLARAIVPGLGSHRLDDVLLHYGLPRPADRHRALPDAKATAEIFWRMLRDGLVTGQLSGLGQLDAIAGVAPKQQTVRGDDLQQTLF